MYLLLQMLLLLLGGITNFARRSRRRRRRHPSTRGSPKGIRCLHPTQSNHHSQQRSSYKM
jgi:hypothetical protein